MSEVNDELTTNISSFSVIYVNAENFVSGMLWNEMGKIYIFFCPVTIFTFELYLTAKLFKSNCLVYFSISLHN